MRVDEAKWIFNALSAWPAHALSPLLDIGAGGELDFATEVIFRPLTERGVRVIHFDRQPFPWIEIAGDLFDAGMQRRLAALPVRSALFANVIEHLPRAAVQRIPEILHDILAPGAILVVTAPLSFPYHHDPIDTLYRPSPEKLAALFAPAGFEFVDSTVIAYDNFRKDLSASGLAGWAHWLFRLGKPFRRPRKWLNAAHSTLWLFRPYRQTLVVLRRIP